VHIEAIDAKLANIDWSSATAIQVTAEPILRELAARPDTLSELIRCGRENALTRSMWEHHPLRDKLVLLTDAVYRLRIHVFLPGHYEQPHDHRWPYCTFILRGRYRHVLYQAHAAPAVGAGCVPTGLEECLVRDEPRGSCYALAGGLFHAIEADPYTVSLVVRGAPTRDRFTKFDASTGEGRWEYGAAKESEATRQRKQMSEEHAESVVRSLHDLRVLS